MQKTVLSAGIILICSSRVRTSSSDSNKVELELSPFKLEQISQSSKQNFHRSLLETPQNYKTRDVGYIDSSLGFLNSLGAFLK